MIQHLVIVTFFLVFYGKVINVILLRCLFMFFFGPFGRTRLPSQLKLHSVHAIRSFNASLEKTTILDFFAIIINN